MTTTTPNYDNAQIGLTESLNFRLGVIRSDQRFEPVFVWDANRSRYVLIIQLNKSYTGTGFGILVYEREYHILGKALRLFVEIEENCLMFAFLGYHRVFSIIVTSATEPDHMNARNKWVFEVKQAKEMTYQLMTTKNLSDSLYNEAIKALVNENPLP